MRFLFDIPDVEFTHYKDKCTFDFIVEKYKITDPAIHTLAIIVRGADTDRHDIASHASGLWAVSAGLAYNVKGDYELLQRGMMIMMPCIVGRSICKKKSIRKILLTIYSLMFSIRILNKNPPKRKKPDWVKELKEIIQDQIDTNLSLTEISKTLDINPSYLSREFSKHFDNLSFGEYIRKLGIEKAVELIKTKSYSLTENCIPHRFFKPKSFYKNF